MRHLKLVPSTTGFHQWGSIFRGTFKRASGVYIINNPSGKRPVYLHPIEKVDEPLDTLHIDHLGRFVKSHKKNSYFIVSVEPFTKFVFMSPVRNTKTAHVETFLENKVISVFGVPKRIIPDRSSAFASKNFANFFCRYNIRLVHNALNTPRANGQVDRYNRSILTALAALTDDESK